jgi:hypothetical protein
MSIRIKALLLPAIIALAASFSAGQAAAQTASFGCTLEAVAGTGRHVVRCQRGISITVEEGARYTLIDRDGDNVADGVRLRRKALLLDVPRGASGSGFVVVTPQAIAAVRGTEWAVDVQGRRTSVLVLEGNVSVGRPASGAAVGLGPGQGVDVEPGTAPLTVRRWPDARVAALLARLGR